MKKITLYSLFFMVLVGCNNYSYMTRLSGYMDIDKNEKLYFIYQFQDGQSIFSLDLKALDLVQLTEKGLYTGVTAFGDNKSISYIKQEKVDLESSKYVIYKLNTLDFTNIQVASIDNFSFGLKYNELNDNFYFVSTLNSLEAPSKPSKPLINYNIYKLDASDSLIIKPITKLNNHHIAGLSWGKNNKIYTVISDSLTTFPYEIDVTALTNEDNLEKLKILINQDLELVDSILFHLDSTKINIQPIAIPTTEDIYYLWDNIIYVKSSDTKLKKYYTIELPSSYIATNLIFFPLGNKFLITAADIDAKSNIQGFIFDCKTLELIKQIDFDMSHFSPLQHIKK